MARWSPASPRSTNPRSPASPLPSSAKSGGDRSAVTGGTRVVSDWIKVKVTQKPGESFLDRMIAMVEGAERQKTPNEIALNILLVGMTIIFVLVVVTLEPFVIYSGAFVPVVFLIALLVTLIPTTIGGLAVGDRHCRHGPAGEGKRHRQVGPRRGGGRRRRHAASRQDRHDHHRRAHGGCIRAGLRCKPAGAGGSRPSGLARRRDSRGQVDR